MTIVKFEIDVEEWYRGDEYSEGPTFNEFLKGEVVHELASRIYTTLEKPVIDEIKTEALATVTKMIDDTVAKIMRRGIRFDDGKHTLKNIIDEAINVWATAEPKNNQSWGNKNIKGLKEMMNDIILVALTKEFRAVLDDVKNDAVKEARANIAQMVAIKLFDGQDLMKIQPPIPRAQ